MVVETSFEYVEAFISFPSLSLNIFILNFMSELLWVGWDDELVKYLQSLDISA